MNFLNYSKYQMYIELLLRRVVELLCLKHAWMIDRTATNYHINPRKKRGYNRVI